VQKQQAHTLPSDLLALKRLTISDLSWFRSIFIRRDLPGKQKAINLNVDVFEPMFSALAAQRAEYMEAKQDQRSAPNAKERAAAKARAISHSHIPVLTTIHGPEGKPPMVLERVVAFQDKNTRLGGRFVLDPDDDPYRFDPVLQEGDLCLMGFGGKELPTSATLILVAADSSVDAPLYSLLDPLVGTGRDSMRRLRPSRLEGIAAALKLPRFHPVSLLAIDPDLTADIEAALTGGVESVARVWRRRTGRRMSLPDLARSLDKVNRLGRDGERLVDRWLAANADELGADGHVWMADDGAATHPYDFRLTDAAGKDVAYLEVKATTGDWKAEFYMSRNEVAAAAEAKIPYLIARVSEVGPTGAWLRVSEDLSAKASAIIKEHPDDKPLGARVASVSMSPERLKLKWQVRERLEPLVRPKVTQGEASPDEDGDGDDDT
jgi:hypothetical protein